jgi:hypothetical protein
VYLFDELMLMHMPCPKRSISSIIPNANPSRGPGVDHHIVFIAFKLNSTPTKVAAYHISLSPEKKVDELTLAGKARAMAGPNPFHSAVTPSAAMSFRAQSRKPEYVP